MPLCAPPRPTAPHSAPHRAPSCTMPPPALRHPMPCCASLQVIPLVHGSPGACDVVVAGGPPCQGLSGFNRRAERVNIFSDPKNRLIQPYLDIVGTVRPAYIVIEQVSSCASILSTLGVHTSAGNGHERYMGMSGRWSA
eukprot:124268-Chlamydomonas_euryale.AAC.1